MCYFSHSMCTDKVINSQVHTPTLNWGGLVSTDKRHVYENWVYMCAWKFPISTEYLVHTQSRKNLFTHASCTTRPEKFINRLPHYFFFFSGKKIYYYYYTRVYVYVFSIQNVLHNIGKKLCSLSAVLPRGFRHNTSGRIPASSCDTEVGTGPSAVHYVYIL